VISETLKGAVIMSSIVALVVAIVMAVWVYKVVNRHGGQLPWLWAIGAFVFWPLAATVAGFKYDETAMKVVGIIGLCLIVVGIVMAIGLVAFL
jgi:hypothetical protein